MCVALKETTGTLCTYSTHAMCWQFVIRDVIIKKSEVGSIPDNIEDLTTRRGVTATGDLVPSDRHRDDSKKEEGTYTAVKEEWHYPESINTLKLR